MNKKVLAIIMVLILSIGLITWYKVIYKKEENKNVALYLAFDNIDKTENIKDEENTNILLSFGYVSGKSNDEFELVFKERKGDTVYTKDIEKVKKDVANIREKYKKAKISISIGGSSAGGSKEEVENFYNFSEMAKMEGNRKIFIDSLIDFIRDTDIDGVDINWEFPVQGGWGNIKSAPEDKANFTYLMKDLRVALDKLSEENQKKKYYLSFANTAQEFGLEVFEIDKVLEIVDFMNLMTYDFAGNWTNRTALNAPLYKSDNFKNDNNNIDDVIKMYEDEGLTKYFNKILIGIPSYAYGWLQVRDAKDGANQLAKDVINAEKNTLKYRTVNGNTNTIKYYDIKDDKEKEITGLKRIWDDKAKAAYLYKEGEEAVFISYEDPEAVREKAEYIKSKGLGGMMMWEASYDDGTLINEMKNNLK